ncbi:ABC transporter permease [Candidatus Kapaibacterium sp.]
MKVEQFIAFRYIITKRTYHFISIITILSLIGITVGVAAIIAVLSIFNGFQVLTKSQFIGFDPHIRIIPESGAWINFQDSLYNEISKIEEIEIISKNIQGRIIGSNRSELQVFTLVTVPEDKSYYLDGVRKSTIFGKFSISSDNRLPNIVIGNAIADRLRVSIGDTIRLLSAKQVEQAIVSFARQREVKAIVSGIFMSNIKDYDITYGFSSDVLGKLLFNPKIGAVSAIDIKLKNIDDLNNIKSKLENYINDDKFKVITWQELNPDLFNIMKFERFATFAILSIIIFLAVFNVLVSLSMTVVEKRQDIGVLKALGADNKIISRIFIWEGIAIGIVSTLAGTLLGLGFCYGQINFKWFKIDGSKFIIDAIPVEVVAMDVITVAVFSLVLTSLAKIYPSIRASSTTVIESIRSE